MKKGFYYCLWLLHIYYKKRYNESNNKIDIALTVGGFLSFYFLMILVIIDYLFNWDFFLLPKIFWFFPPLASFIISYFLIIRPINFEKINFKTSYKKTLLCMFFLIASVIFFFILTFLNKYSK